MPSKEIKELRESGKLHESHEMALREFEAAPDNIWALRNLAWSFYYLLKENQDNTEKSLSIIQKIIGLKIPDNEIMFLDKFCWAVGSNIFHILNSQENQHKMKFVDVVFEQIKLLKFSPSAGFSFLIKAFHKSFKEVNDYSNNSSNESQKYSELIEWIGFDNFMEEDYKPYQMDGRQVISFVEQVIIAYAKVLLKGDKIEKEGIIRYEINQIKIEEFLIFLDVIIEKHPEFEYSLYFKAKLVLLLKRFDEAKKTLIPFVKKKKNLFWVWELLGEAHADDIDVKIGCLCKALTLNTKESFLVNVHQKLADLLVQEELYKEASVEVINAFNIRKKNDWKINNELIKYTHQNWFDKNRDLKSNKKFYEEQSILAEELIYNNQKEITIAIDFVNSNKMMANFIKDKNLYGFFNYKHLKINPKTGDIFKARLNQKGDEGFYTILTIKPSADKVLECVKEISGSICIQDNKDFGFIENNFVSPDLIKKHHLKDGDEITGKVILSFNKKKNEWGWKVFQLK